MPLGMALLHTDSGLISMKRNCAHELWAVEQPGMQRVARELLCQVQGVLHSDGGQVLQHDHQGAHGRADLLEVLNLHLHMCNVLLKFQALRR